MRKLVMFVLTGVLWFHFCDHVYAAEIESAEAVTSEADAVSDAADSEILSENDTSVIIPMKDIPASQLGVSDVYKANPYNDFKNLNLPDHAAGKLLLYRGHIQ